ncbi:hypothetical protein [Bradyrhizobium sp. CCBAU 51753]|uniref:hypothetical protein n=1 Tax=Bradyrhizobium sp. CCBAU 51753 TaxID=1325100 RepID=UPI00188D9372|nr:hypothetical protein [Bradyrhizobium sp. CCBAU 51753]QOZ25279.1 hypothetical protein XH93_18045 [Bradyrhizobium sp. CCBAU 51753]
MLAEDLQGDIAELLDDPDYGRKVVLRREVPGTYDETTGATAPATQLSNTTRGLLLGYRDSLVDGTLIKRGDRKCILRVKGMTMSPQETDLLDVFDKTGKVITDTYTVVSFKTGELGGVPYLYTLQVRK